MCSESKLKSEVWPLLRSVSGHSQITHTLHGGGKSDNSFIHFWTFLHTFWRARGGVSEICNFERAQFLNGPLDIWYFIRLSTESRKWPTIEANNTFCACAFLANYKTEWKIQFIQKEKSPDTRHNVNTCETVWQGDHHAGFTQEKLTHKQVLEWDECIYIKQMLRADASRAHTSYCVVSKILCKMHCYHQKSSHFGCIRARALVVELM